MNVVVDCFDVAGFRSIFLQLGCCPLAQCHEAWDAANPRFWAGTTAQTLAPNKIAMLHSSPQRSCWAGVLAPTQAMCWGLALLACRPVGAAPPALPALPKGPWPPRPPPLGQQGCGHSSLSSIASRALGPWEAFSHALENEHALRGRALKLIMI